MAPKYPEWVKIPWDGNPELDLECWRKTFGSGYVSVGVGEFHLIVFSYGANSDSSHSSTRWNYDDPVTTEEEAMAILDKTAARELRGCRGYQHPARKVRK